MLASHNTSSKHRSQHYEEQPQCQDNAMGSVRERVLRDSPIIAELRTNVIIKDEYTLVRDLSHHLAARYTRPDPAIMVQVDHSVCLAFGGNFDPCYILTLTTGPSQMGPTMNKRNAALIQSFMADVLGVPAERGVVKFHAMPEENFAYNGTTLLGEIERRGKQHEKENGIFRAAEHTSKRMAPSQKKSSPKPDLEVDQNEPVFVAVKQTDSKSADAKVAEPKTLTALRPKTAMFTTETKRTSATLPLGVSATILSPAGIYELPAVEMERKRSTSAHRQTSNGSNGLRMNPVSRPDPEPKGKHLPGLQVKEKRKSNSHLHSRSNSQCAPPQSPPPSSVQRPTQPVAAPLPQQERPLSFLKNEYTKSSHRQSRPLSTNNNMSAPVAMREKPMRMLGVREAYVEGLMGKPHLIKGLGPGQTVLEKASQELLGQEPTANTAKRRSTMTATPKLPETPMRPEAGDAKSVKSAKTGKRQSFMAALKRSVATA